MVQAKQGSVIRTVVEVRSGVDGSGAVAAGTNGVVRGEHADALGGYEVELTAEDGIVHQATLYANQFEVVEEPNAPQS